MSSITFDSILEHADGVAATHSSQGGVGVEGSGSGSGGFVLVEYEATGRTVRLGLSQYRAVYGHILELMKPDTRQTLYLRPLLQSYALLVDSASDSPAWIPMCLTSRMFQFKTAMIKQQLRVVCEPTTPPLNMPAFRLDRPIARTALAPSASSPTSSFYTTSGQARGGSMPPGQQLLQVPAPRIRQSSLPPQSLNAVAGPSNLNTTWRSSGAGSLIGGDLGVGCGLGGGSGVTGMSGQNDGIGIDAGSTAPGSSSTTGGGLAKRRMGNGRQGGGGGRDGKASDSEGDTSVEIGRDKQPPASARFKLQDFGTSQLELGSDDIEFDLDNNGDWTDGFDMDAYGKVGGKVANRTSSGKQIHPSTITTTAPASDALIKQPKQSLQQMLRHRRAGTKGAGGPAAAVPKTGHTSSLPSLSDQFAEWSGARGAPKGKASKAKGKADRNDEREDSLTETTHQVKKDGKMITVNPADYKFVRVGKDRCEHCVKDDKKRCYAKNAAYKSCLNCDVNHPRGCSLRKDINRQLKMRVTEYRQSFVTVPERINRLLRVGGVDDALRSEIADQLAGLRADSEAFAELFAPLHFERPLPSLAVVDSDASIESNAANEGDADMDRHSWDDENDNE